MEDFTKEELKNLIIGFCVLCVCLVVATVYNWQRNVWADAKQSDYTVYATFNRTDGLSIGDKVRMGGVDIGYIENSVLEDDFRATLTLKIRNDIQIPDDSGAAIVSSGVMGNKYIEIEPGGSDDFIADNGYFSFTQDAMVLEELIDRIISMGKAKRKEPAPNTADNTPTEEN